MDKMMHFLILANLNQHVWVHAFQQIKTTLPWSISVIMCIQKKFQHTARNHWTIFRNFSDKEKKISCIRFSKKTTVLFKSNADTCLQNLPKFLAFLQILDHYKILTTFLWIFEAHTVLTGLNFWWDIPRGYSCDSELIEQKFILLCEFSATSH